MQIYVDRTSLIGVDLISGFRAGGKQVPPNVHWLPKGKRHNETRHLPPSEDGQEHWIIMIRSYLYNTQSQLGRLAGPHRGWGYLQEHIHKPRGYIPIQPHALCPGKWPHNHTVLDGYYAQHVGIKKGHVYIYDIVTLSKNYQSHNNKIENFLNMLLEASTTLKP